MTLVSPKHVFGLEMELFMYTVRRPGGLLMTEFLKFQSYFIKFHNFWWRFVQVSYLLDSIYVLNKKWNAVLFAIKNSKNIGSMGGRAINFLGIFGWGMSWKGGSLHNILSNIRVPPWIFGWYALAALCKYTYTIYICVSMTWSVVSSLTGIIKEIAYY